MLEIKKYLNRDGLDEYNSLLPHSSSEMQEYVNAWLDAHPEATTTVQNGAISEPKLADKSVSLRTLADDTVHTLKGMMVTREISGEVLTADDAYSAPPVALTVEGKSTQDGTPTPDAPVEIDSIEVESVVINAIGANRAYIDASAEGITYIDDTYEGTITALRNALRCVYPVPAGSSITVTLKPSSSQSGNLNIIGKRADTGGNVYLITAPNNTTNWGTYTAVTSYELSEIRISHNASDTRVWQMRELCIRADGLSAYVPYSQVSANVPTLGNILRSLPNGTHDTLSLTYLRPRTREGWAWYTPTLTKVTNEAVFDESYNWSRNAGTKASDGTWRFECNIGNKGQPISIWGNTNAAVPAYCSHLRATKSAYLYSAGTDMFAIYQQRLYVRISEIATLDELKTWLAENPLTIQYPITPITTQLAPIELPVLPAPDVTVWSDPSTGLQMRYMRDSNLVIQRIEEAIADQ